MAKLRITGFLLVFPPSDDNLIKSQMVSGLLPKRSSASDQCHRCHWKLRQARMGDFIFVVKANGDNKRISDYFSVFEREESQC